MTIAQLAEKYENDMIAIRRDFHQHAELSFAEKRTVETICKHLTEYGIPFEKTGHDNVVGVIGKDKKGKRIAIRADIDALPITEDTGLPYASENVGCMHACGHDGHAAILLTIARALKEVENELNGTVYLCFQVAEEIGKGADEVVAYLKEHGGVDRVIGTHLSGGDPVGTIYLPDGALMAGAKSFVIDVAGVGGHGSRPDKAVDPVKPTCDILLKIASIPAQYHNPFDTCVVSPCMITAGNKNNIIPDHGHIEGNIRFFKYGDGDKIVEQIRTIAENTAKAYGTTATVSSISISPTPVINDPASAAMGREIAQRIGLKVLPQKDPTMGSDNYCEFLSTFPGFYCDTGAFHEGYSGNHHNPKFDVDEKAFKKVMEFLATYAYEYLK